MHGETVLASLKIRPMRQVACFFRVHRCRKSPVRSPPQGSRLCKSLSLDLLLRNRELQNNKGVFARREGFAEARPAPPSDHSPEVSWLQLHAAYGNFRVFIAGFDDFHAVFQAHCNQLASLMSSTFLPSTLFPNLIKKAMLLQLFLFYFLLTQSHWESCCCFIPLFHSLS